MAEHEPLNIASQDNAAERPEARAARKEGADARGPERLQSRAGPSDDAAAGSESMTLERLVDAAPPPPGRQRTGDPPAKRSTN